jgi:hypothetical protein
LFAWFIQKSVFPVPFENIGDGFFQRAGIKIQLLPGFFVADVLVPFHDDFQHLTGIQRLGTGNGTVKRDEGESHTGYPEGHDQARGFPAGVMFNQPGHFADASPGSA